MLNRVHRVRPELVAEVKYLTWTDDNLLRQVVYEGLREEAGGRRGSPAGAALTTLTASLNDQIGPYRRWEWAFMGRIGINVAGPSIDIPYQEAREPRLNGVPFAKRKSPVRDRVPSVRHVLPPPSIPGHRLGALRWRVTGVA